MSKEIITLQNRTISFSPLETGFFVNILPGLSFIYLNLVDVPTGFIWTKKGRPTLLPKIARLPHQINPLQFFQVPVHCTIKDKSQISG